jgi:hypothetical protein
MASSSGSSASRTFAGISTIYRQRKYWEEFFPQFKISRKAANSTTIWQQPCSTTPAS